MAAIMDPRIASLCYIAGTLWIVGWATYRALGPTKGQRLQSDWVLAARFIYVFSYLMIFIGGTGIFVFGGKLSTGLANEVLQTFPLLGEVTRVLGGETAPLAPLFSLGMIYLVLKIGFVNRSDRRVLAWLHSTEHLEDEMQKLRLALETSSFEPSEIESAKNRRKLQEHDVLISDNQLISGDISVVSQWRKVACLLRLVDSWQESTTKVLTPQEEKELREIESTDSRKTAHAFDIIRALRHSALQGREIGAEDLHVIVHDRSSLSSEAGEIGENNLPEVPDSTRGERNSTVQLNPEEFEGYIVKIQNYFLEEYEIILRRISTLAAESVVFSGEEAAIRFDKFKTAGYLELGEINRLTMDNIVKLFCLTVIFVVSTFLLALVFSGRPGPSALIVLKIGLIYAFATLSGAMIGSNRTLARRPHTPWTAFAAAGLMSFLLFLFINFSLAMSQAFLVAFQDMANGGQDTIFAKLSFGRVGSDQSQGNIAFIDILPWALLPTFASVAICRISRISWPRQWDGLTPRLLDGLILSGVFVMVSTLVFSLHVRLETRMAGVLTSNGELQFGAVLTGSLITATLGFLMGCTAIADIRKIATSEILNGQTRSDSGSTSSNAAAAAIDRTPVAT